MATSDVRLADAQRAREKAFAPEDLGRMFIERANAGDVDGLVALYEPGAVLSGPGGKIATGRQAIRQGDEGLLASQTALGSEGRRPALGHRHGPLTSTRP